MSKSMTPERAIKKHNELIEYLKHSLEIDSDCCLLDKDKQMIILALKYRIPKKPVIGDTFSEKFQKAIIKTGSNPDIVKGQSYKCPVCNHRIIMLWEVERNKRIYGWKCKDIFCNKCGQALDWSDEE